VSAHDYHFVTRWRVEGTCGEVADILGDAVSLPRWWPAVYLSVEELQPRDADGLGGRVRLTTKGWLPYILRWESTIVESNYPFGFTLMATGDFVGRGAWTFEQDNPFVDITYDWRISAEKPLLRTFSPLFKPLFAANHRWAMAQGQTSLELELARRRSASEEARRGVPAPPQPVTYAGAALLAGGGAVAITLAMLMIRAGRRRHRRRRVRRPAR
jgi:hypothetical protein